MYACPTTSVPKVGQAKISKAVDEQPKKNRMVTRTRNIRKEAMNKLRRKYITEKHQNILICEKNGKLIATLRCVLCNLFVRKGEQYCHRCKEYLETGKKPAVQRRLKHEVNSLNPPNKCRKCSVVIKKSSILCIKCKGVLKAVKSDSKQSANVDCIGTSKKIAKKKSVLKQSYGIKKRIIKKHVKNARCLSCNATFVHNKGDICRKCTRKLENGNTNTQITMKRMRAKNERDSTIVLKREDSVIVKEEEDIMKTVQSLNDIENVEIVEEDEDEANNTIFRIPLIEVDEDVINADKSNYYVSIDDINNMLEEDSTNVL